MLTYTQAVFLGFLQGVTELFPISSLGHSVLIPQLLGWQLDQASSQFVGFIVATHLGTSLVLFAFFWREWIRIIISVLSSIWNRTLGDDPYAKLGWLLIVGTIPAGLLGLLLQKRIEGLFAAGTLVAAALFCNGLMLFAAEALRKNANSKAGDATKLSFGQSLLIGIAQVLALVPGISRTGVTMTGGLLSGLSHETSARFSFLLATPIIFAAAVLELPKLSNDNAGIAVVGAVCAAAAAYVSVRFLTKYFETKTLRPFAWYCLVAGLLAFLYLSL